ncbi:MAG: hypothetical protein KGH72_04595 [Candidatus Micrarchaeota archaeon]|nr:hypothetical protein [Candidatus Micrarchaeota archaeon]
MPTRQKRAASLDVPGRGVIVPTGEHADWLAARRLVMESGLPSNELHDDTLSSPMLMRALLDQGYYPAWAREVLVYPTPHGTFVKGRDLVDSFADDSGRKWVFPAASIPDLAIGMKNVALFVDPQYVEVDVNRVAIMALPGSIKLLTPFMQEEGWGVMDEVTRIPLALDVAGVPANRQRWLWRLDGAGVRPIVRYTHDFDGRWEIVGNGIRSSSFGVAMVEVQEQ